jgi:hypothetical protein
VGAEYAPTQGKSLPGVNRGEEVSEMKKLGFIAISIVTVLATLGIGFSMWSQNIAVNGNVKTGSVSWQFYSCNLLDENSPSDGSGYIWPGTGSQSGWINANADWTVQNGFVGGPTRLDKNVAWGECNISTDGTTLNVILHNTYPCNFNSLSFYVKNTGTLPIKVWKAEILDNLGNVVATYYTESAVPSTGVALNLDGVTGNDLEIRYGDNFGLQIEPNTQSSGEFSIWFHTLQPSPQGATLTFSIRLTAVQWNEYTAGPITTVVTH